MIDLSKLEIKQRQFVAYLGATFGIASIATLVSYALWSAYMYLSSAISASSAFPPLRDYSGGDVFAIVLGFVVSLFLGVGIVVAIVSWVIWSFETVWRKR